MYNNIFGNFYFQSPWFFALLLLVPFAFFWYRSKRARAVAFFTMPHLGGTQGLSSWRIYALKFLPFLRLLAFTCLVFALARPQLVFKEEEVLAEGVDIMLVMDLSASMLAQDFKPNRLEASKEVAAQFVTKRQHDRVGLVVFSGEAFTQCPLTTDHDVLRIFLADLQCGVMQDGTAIGMGLATGVNRIKDGKAKSKVIILLTDGVNNSGYIQPIQAAEIAREYGIKVYTIGVGTTGDALGPVHRRSDGQYVFGLMPVEIDEDLLTNIADMTGGRYFRATTRDALEDIYTYIDSMEKTKIEVTTLRREAEMFRPFLLVGMFLLLIELLLRNTILRVWP